MKKYRIHPIENRSRQCDLKSSGTEELTEGRFVCKEDEIPVEIKVMGKRVEKVRFVYLSGGNIKHVRRGTL